MRTVTAVFMAALLMTGAASAQTPVIIEQQVVSLRHVDFVFSEPMSRRSIEEEASVLLYPDGLPGSPLGIWAVYLAPDGVTMRLYLIDGMASGGLYTLALDGVVSAQAVPVEEGYTYTFSAIDLVAPGLAGVDFLDDESIDLVFTEDIVEAAGETASNYLLYETAVPAHVIGFTEVRMRGMYDRVFLRLDSPLSVGTEYTIEVSGLSDPSGNPLPAGSAVTFTYESETEYPLIGLYTDGNRYNSAIDGEGIYTVEIWYWVRTVTEGMKAATFAVDYPSNVIPEELELAPGFSVLGGNVFDGIYITTEGGCAYGWTWMARQRITVVDDLPSIVATIPFRVLPYYSYVMLMCLEDYPQVKLHSTANVELNAVDARPVALGASFSGYSLIDIVFNVPMDPATTGDVANYEVFESEEPGNTVALESADVGHDNRTVRLVTSTALSEGVDYTARMTGIENEVGTAIYPGSEITFSALDEQSPHVVSAAMSAQRTIDVLFDEPVDELSASSMSNYEIAESSHPSNRKPLYSAALLADGMTARLTINGLFENETDYTVTVRNLKDVHGNGMQQKETVEFFADDIYPPEVIYVVSLPGDSILIHFNEPLDEVTAGDIGNYYFPYYPSASVVSVTWQGSSVILASSGFSFGSRYNLYMRDVEDAVGNAMPDGWAAEFYYTPEVPLPVIGLWSDLQRTQSFVESHPFIPFEFYVWCRPGPNGIKAIEFALADRSIRDFRYGIISVEYDPDYSVPLGDPFSGITIGVHNCKYDWFWMVKCTAYLMQGSGYIEVVPHPLTGLTDGCLCLEGYPVVLLETTQILTFSTVVGTFLQAYSAEYTGGGIAVRWEMIDIDEGVAFTVLRKRGGNGQFVPVPSQEISRDGMAFEFVDNDIERGVSYTYRIDYSDEGGTHILFETDPVETPAYSLTLEQNRPNPFNPSTIIGFSLPKRCSVRLEIFDTAGRLVAVLRDGVMDAGVHEAVWDGTNSTGTKVGSGVYFYRLRAGKESVSNKMVLLR